MAQARWEVLHHYHRHACEYHASLALQMLSSAIVQSDLQTSAARSQKKTKGGARLSFLDKHVNGVQVWSSPSICMDLRGAMKLC
jgi:hypothetical protein